jgi:hypothetical protein
MGSFGDHLRRHVGRCPVIGVNVFVILIHYNDDRYTDETEPKINDFEIKMLIEQNILRFDISMRNIHFMQIFNSIKNLHKNNFGLLLVEVALLF